MTLYDHRRCSRRTKYYKTQVLLLENPCKTSGIISPGEKGLACSGRRKVMGVYNLLNLHNFNNPRTTYTPTTPDHGSHVYTHPAAQTDRQPSRNNTTTTLPEPWFRFHYLFAVNHYRGRRLAASGNWTSGSPAMNPGPRGFDTRHTPTLVSAAELKQT